MRSKFGLTVGLGVIYPKLLQLFNTESRFLIISLRMSGVAVICENLFKGEMDMYRGVSVSSNIEPRTEIEFPKVLQCSIAKWKETKVRAVWMKVFLEHTYWIPTLVGNGFTYHHAKTNYVTLVKWLPDDEPYNIPGFAHNTIGVGAFVVNDEEELLVVRERFHKLPHWKLPGGYVELGEDLSMAAIREVKEETGIDTEFASVLAFRHMHNANFGCSNLYFVVHLRPKSREITMCKKELADCQWMKMKDYLEHPDVIEMNKLFCERYLEGKLKGVRIKSVNQTLKFKHFSRDQVIYFVDTLSESPSSEAESCGTAEEATSSTASKI